MVLVRRPHNRADWIGALFCMAIGVMISLEAYRLQAYAQSLYVGDHTLPAILGFWFVMLGGVLLVQSYPGKAHAAPPRQAVAPGDERPRVLFAGLSLLLYAWLIGAMGYLLATALASVAFFMLIGFYRLYVAVFYSLLLTGAMYAVFILWLQMPFPGGDLW